MAEVVDDTMTVTVRLTKEEVTTIREALGDFRLDCKAIYDFFDKLEDKMMGR